MNNKRGMIPPYALFCLFFVSRIVVTLTYVQGVSIGVFNTDILLSIALSLVLLIVLSLPAYYCVIKGKNPLDNRFLSVLYSLYFCYYTAITISRFAYFASSRMNTELSMVVVIILVIIATCYGAYLGIESIGRFGFLCAIMLGVTLVAVIGLNIHNIQLTNFYPLSQNTPQDIIKNAFLFSSNSVAPVYLLALKSRVNGKIKASYFGAIITVYCAMLLLILFCCGVMGSAGTLQSYPIYTLFQLASIGTFARLDMLHTAFWILAVLLKCSLLIYCASVSVKKYSHTAKCLVFAVLTGVVAIILDEVVGTAIVTPAKIISVVLFCLFALMFPVLSLVFKRRDSK